MFEEAMNEEGGMKGCCTKCCKVTEVRRGFEFVRNFTMDGDKKVFLLGPDGETTKKYLDARYPEYSTKRSAGADFFCAEEVTIPSIWSVVPLMDKFLKERKWCDENNQPLVEGEGSETYKACIDYCTELGIIPTFKPTLVHTGIKACMGDDEVLEIYNRSSNPMKLGLVLANSVGIIDADYYDNEGEVMFAYFNFGPEPVTLHVGDKVGQGIFKKTLKPTVNCVTKDVQRVDGFGSTGR